MEWIPWRSSSSSSCSSPSTSWPSPTSSSRTRLISCSEISTALENSTCEREDPSNKTVLGALLAFSSSPVRFECWPGFLEISEISEIATWWRVSLEYSTHWEISWQESLFWVFFDSSTQSETKIKAGSFFLKVPQANSFLFLNFKVLKFAKPQTDKPHIFVRFCVTLNVY